MEIVSHNGLDIEVYDLRPADYTIATRGHAYRLYKPRCVNTTRSRYFAERIVNVWNFLPSSVNFSTLNAFKRSIVPIDFSLFLKCVTE